MPAKELRTVRIARKLRRAETEAERRLWNRLRNRRLGGHKFVRQFPVGSYFADLVCRETMLVVELDDGQHDGAPVEVERTLFLNSKGYSVLRLWNNQVLANLDGILTAIAETLAHRPSPDWHFAPATLSPEGRGEEGAAQ